MFGSRAIKALVILGWLLAFSGLAGLASGLRQAIAEQGRAAIQEQAAPELPARMDLLETRDERQLQQIWEALQSSQGESRATPPVPSVWIHIDGAENDEQASELLEDDPAIPETPARLVIPSIQLDAPVVSAEPNVVKLAGKEFQQWSVPDDFAAGWHATSARLGETGNTVLNGHNNLHGEVFANLEQVKVGDSILVYSDTRVYAYLVTNAMIFPEKYEQLDVRMDNARWIMPSTDERLTLISCWPYESNSHRLIVVAVPMSVESLVGGGAE